MQFLWFFLFTYLSASYVSYVIHAADDPTSWTSESYSWKEIIGENVVRVLYIFGMYWSFENLIQTLR